VFLVFGGQQIKLSQKQENTAPQKSFNLSLTVFNSALTICYSGALYFYIVNETLIQKFLHK